MRRLFVSLALLGGGVLLSAQTEQRYELSLSLGLHVLHSDSFALADNLDYIDYFERSEPDYLPEPYIGLSGTYFINKQMDLDLELVLWSDFSVADLQLTYAYLLWPNVGFNVGVYTHATYVSYYEEFQKQNEPLYVDMNRNLRQFKLKERGVVVGPKFAFERSRFRFYAFANVAFGYYKPFTDRYILKEVNGNKRIAYTYAAQGNYHLSWMPKASVAYDLFSSEKQVLGLQAALTYYWSRQSIDYERSYAEWTPRAPSHVSITSVKHTVTRCYPSLSVYWRW